MTGRPAARDAATLALALATASLGLHILAAGLTALSPQEAYYWQWARHLDLSYFDHPPLAAWTIGGVTALFGEGERAVRLAAALHAAVFSLFFFLAGRRLFGGRAALLALLAACLTPLFAVGQAAITPDGPLLAGWAAALYCTVRALQEERGGWLVGAGLATGFAALGKYTGWLLAPQILLALLLDARGRRLLRGPGPWLGLALAVVLFAPVLVWNARHGWASFRFQTLDRGAAAGAFSLARVGRFVGLQALALTPVLGALVWAAPLVAARRGRDPALRVCAVFALPALALFVAVSPFAWVKGNWPAPAYPAALLAAAGLWLGDRPRLRAVALGTAAAGTLYLHLAVALPALPFPAGQDVTRGWPELAARVEAERERLPAPAFVVGCGYKVASELAYYLPDRPETWSHGFLGGAGLQYDLWGDPATLAGREGLLVLDPRDGRGCQAREAACRPLLPLPPVEVRRGGGAVTTFRLWRCRYLGPAGSASSPRAPRQPTPGAAAPAAAPTTAPAGSP